MNAATRCAAARSSAARLGETPSTASTRSGPRARTASASSTEESTPPENARRRAHPAAGSGNRAAVLRHAPLAAARAARLGAHREAADRLRLALQHHQRPDLLWPEDAAAQAVATARDRGGLAELAQH